MNLSQQPTFFSPPVLKDGKAHVAWDFHYTNYGRSPAYGIKFGGYMEIGEGATKRRQAFQMAGSGAPIPPGKDDFRSAFSKLPVTREEFDKLMRSDEQIVVHGKFEYTDASGGEYEIGFCFLHLATGATAYCQDSQNYMK